MCVGMCYDITSWPVEGGTVSALSHSARVCASDNCECQTMQLVLLGLRWHAVTCHRSSLTGMSCELVEPNHTLVNQRVVA